MRQHQACFLVFLALTAAGCSGPLGPFAGGRLSGESAPYPTSWHDAVSAEQVQLETYGTDGAPHSVNIWCVVHFDRLFFTTSLVRGEENPEKRVWVRNALTNTDARVRVGDHIYRGSLRKVLDDNLESGVKRAFVLKYDHEEDERTEDAWVFELTKKQA